MKKTIWLFFFLPTFLFGQVYHPMLETDKTWFVGISYFLDYPPNFFISQYQYQGDTLINGITYQNYGVLVRENTFTKKVFMHSPGGGANDECLLYDFSLQAGDFYNGCDFSVNIDSVSMIQLENGEWRKIFYYNGFDYYIEGIGSNIGFDYLGSPIGPPSIDLMCVQQNSVNLFGSNCARITDTRDFIASSSSIQLYPNPSQRVVSISSSLDIQTFQIVDALGEPIKSGQVDQDQIDLHGLSGGIYFVLLYDRKNRLVGTKKVVKLVVGY